MLYTSSEGEVFYDTGECSYRTLRLLMWLRFMRRLKLYTWRHKFCHCNAADIYISSETVSVSYRLKATSGPAALCPYHLRLEPPLDALCT